MTMACISLGRGNRFYEWTGGRGGGAGMGGSGREGEDVEEGS